MHGFCTTSPLKAFTQRNLAADFLSAHMRSHSVTCHPAAVNSRLYPSHSQPVLDLATPDGCKAELTWAVVYPQNAVTYLRNNRAVSNVSWLEIEPATESRKFNVLTFTPPSHLCVSVSNLPSYKR